MAKKKTRNARRTTTLEMNCRSYVWAFLSVMSGMSFLL